MLVVLKPVLWNPDGYQRPAGHRRKGKQYADRMGFALEEWNASPMLGRRIVINGSSHRAFHAEPVPAAAKHPGATTIFLYASHGGKQYLVGVAARATNVIDGDALVEPVFKAMKAARKRMAEQAWNTPGVPDRFGRSRAAFRSKIPEDHFMPGWICPSDCFLWLDEPVPIDVKRLTGRKKLVTEYRGSQGATVDKASQLLRHIPVADRNAAWQRIARQLFDRDAFSAGDVRSVVDPRDGRAIPETTRKALVDARLGQGRFRAGVLANWGNACAVTGVATPAALRASHIRPWCACRSNKERLDPHNGIPLVASLDALFDSYLISFDAKGKMLVSPSIPLADRPKLGIGSGLRTMLKGNAAAYMAQHRAIFEARKKTLSGA